MKFRGKYQEESTGSDLSSVLPASPDEIQRVILAEMREAAGKAGFRFERGSLEMDLETTGTELERTPERIRCYRLVNAMPEIALPEVESELGSILGHYLAVLEEQERARPSSLQEPAEARVGRITRL